MNPIKKNGSYFIKDEEVKNAKYDKFKHNDIAENMINIIENSSPPYNIAVVGKWGLGKSSLINMVKTRFENDKKNYIVEDINAWKYEKEALKRVLFKRILFKLGHKDRNGFSEFCKNLFSYNGSCEEKQKNIWNQLKTEWLPIATIAMIIYLASNLIMFLTNTISIKFLDISWINLDFFSKSDNAFKNFICSFYFPLLIVLFQKFINTSSGKHNFRVVTPITATDEYEGQIEELISKKEFKNKKIIVIVDDLDRLTPDKIVEALDAIKAFVGYSNFIFIVPFDETILKDAIKEKKTNFTHNEHLTIESDLFLDKLFQHRIFLPSTIQSNLPEYAIEIANNDAKDLVDLCGDEFFKRLCKEILIHKKVTTPRQVKKILNAFSNNLLLGIRRESNGLKEGTFTSEQSIRFIAKISVLQSDFPSFYSNLFSYNDLMDKFLELSNKSEDARDVKNVSDGVLLPYFTETKLNKTGESLAMFLNRTASVNVENIARCLYLSEDRLSEVFGNEFSLNVRDALTSGAYKIVREKIEENSDKDVSDFLYETLSYSDSNEFEFCCIGIINLSDIDEVVNNYKLYNLVNERLKGLFKSNDIIEAKDLDLRRATDVYEKYNEFKGIDKLILNQFKNENNSLVECVSVFFEKETVLSNHIKKYVKDLISVSCTSESERFNFDNLFNIESLDVNKFYNEYFSNIDMFERLYEDLVSNMNYDTVDMKVKNFVELFKLHVENDDADIVLNMVSENMNNMELVQLLIENLLLYSNKFKNKNALSSTCMKLIVGSDDNMQNHINKFLSIVDWKILSEYEEVVDKYMLENIESEYINEILINVARNDQIEVIPKSIKIINSKMYEDFIDTSTIIELQKLYTDVQKNELMNNLKIAYTYNTYNEKSLQKATDILRMMSSEEDNEKYIDLLANHIRNQISYYDNNTNKNINTLANFKNGIKDDTKNKFLNLSKNYISSNDIKGYLILEAFNGEIPKEQFLEFSDIIISGVNEDKLGRGLELLRKFRTEFVKGTTQLSTYKDFLISHLSNEIFRKEMIVDILDTYSSIGDIKGFISEAIKYDDIQNETIKCVKKFYEVTKIDETADMIKEILENLDDKHIENAKFIFSAWLDDDYDSIFKRLIKNIDDDISIQYAVNLLQIVIDNNKIFKKLKVNLICIIFKMADSSLISKIVSISSSFGKVTKLDDKEKLGEVCYDIFRNLSSDEIKIDVVKFAKNTGIKTPFNTLNGKKREFTDEELKLIKSV